MRRALLDDVHRTVDHLAEALGLRPRLCYPVRHDGVHLGALWLVDDGRPVDDARVGDACLRLARTLAGRGRASGSDELLVDALLVQLVRGVDPARVLELLRAERFVDAARRYEVAVAHPAAADGRALLEDLARRAAPWGSARWARARGCGSSSCRPRSRPSPAGTCAPAPVR